MPIVACSSCKARFKVRIETVGKVMACPKCDAEFRAVALHATERKAHGLPPIAYAGIVVGALLLALLIAKVAGKKDDASAADDGRTAATDSGPAKPAATSAAPVAPVAKEPRDMLADRARDVLEAIRAADESRLGTLLVDFSLMHEDRRAAGHEEKAWRDLPPEEQFLKKEEYVAALIGEGEEREFLRRCVIESVTPTQLKPGSAAAEAVLKDPLEGTSQLVTLRFAVLSGTWKLVGFDRAPAEAADAGPDDTATAAAARLAELRKSQEAEPEAVEPVPGTSATLTSTIEQHVDVLVDPEQTVTASRARRELADIGKPAIPFLLNRLVGLDLADPADTLVGARVTEALRDVTGQDFVIMPGGNEASMTGEGSTENEQCRRRWFTWWRENKTTFEQRVDEPLDPGPQDEDGNG